MTSTPTPTPSTAAAVSGQSTLQQPPNKGSPAEPKTSKQAQATQQSPPGESTPGRQPLGTKISKTPVPIPRLPGFVPASTTREQAASPQKQVPAQEQSTGQWTASSAQDDKVTPTNINPGTATQVVSGEQVVSFQPQDFPDVPGSESMKFMDSLLTNIRTIAYRDEKKS